MLAIHVVVPPHPGVVGGAGILNADIGWTTIIGLLTCIPVGVLGYFAAKRLNRRDYPMLSGTAEQFRLFGTGKSDVEQDATPGGGVAVKTTAKTAPSPAMIITLIVLPILMIMVGTVGAVVLPKGEHRRRHRSLRRRPPDCPADGTRTGVLLPGYPPRLVLTAHRRSHGLGASPPLPS